MSLSPALAPKILQRVSLGPDEIIAITGMFEPNPCHNPVVNHVDVLIAKLEFLKQISGGSGFLGQHIIKLLNERADGVREIRVLDIKPFEKRLGMRACNLEPLFMSGNTI